MASTYTVARTRTIDAAPEAVFPHIDTLSRWQRWSPWEGMDPDMRRTYSGPDSGVGSRYEWSGNKKAGEGSMEVTESVPSEKVVIDLRFLKPFKSECFVDFALAPTQAGGTAVTWTMVGPKNLFMRVLGPIIRMEKAIGKDFEKGLAQLKTVAEG